MTVQEIRKRLSPHKPVSVPTLYRYFETLHIEPVGARQRPQHYPEDAPVRIMLHLGIAVKNGKPAISAKLDRQIVSLTRLKAERSKRGVR